MRKKTKWLSTFKVLEFVPLRRRLIVVTGLLFSSLFELIGLTTLLPLLASIARPDSHKFGIGAMMHEAFAKIGLAYSFELLLAIFVGGLVIKSAITMWTMRYVANIMTDITTDVRLRLLRNLLGARWSYFVRQPLGRLTNLMGPEANAMGETFFVVATFVATVMQIVVYLLVAFAVSWQLALVCIAIGVVMFIWFGKLVTSTRKAARQHATQLNALAANFSDTIMGIRPIKAMGRQARFSELFENDTRRTSDTMRAKVISSEFSSEIQEPLIALGLASGFYFATQIWALPFEHLLVMGLVLVRTIDLFYKTQKTIHKMVISESQYQAIVGTLTETEHEREDLSGTKPPTLEKAIRLEGVSFAYGDNVVFDDVHMTIPAGKITALFGPSGAGKSTLLDLLLGLQRPQQGRILIDGVPLEEIDLTQWRARVGYVPQELTLFHDTILNNITLGDPVFSEEDVVRALTEAGAMSFVQELPHGIHQMVGERGLALSGGQRQRISIARALIHRPSILVLDEATTALDPQTERLICENIRQLARAQNLTILAVSHQPTWQAMADTTIAIRDGQLAAA